MRRNGSNSDSVSVYVWQGHQLEIMPSISLLVELLVRNYIDVCTNSSFSARFCFPSFDCIQFQVIFYSSQTEDFTVTLWLLEINSATEQIHVLLNTNCATHSKLNHSKFKYCFSWFWLRAKFAEWKWSIQRRTRHSFKVHIIWLEPDHFVRRTDGRTLAKTTTTMIANQITFVNTDRRRCYARCVRWLSNRR